MTLELRGRDGEKELLFNGYRVGRETFEDVCKTYLTQRAREKLWRDLENYGRVHVIFALAPSRE